MPVPLTAVAAFVQSGGMKKLLNLGESLLSSLTFCAVKPKGTPLAEVSARAPKFWYSYSDAPYQKNAKGKSRGAIFDLNTGLVFSTNASMDAVFPLADRRKVEATLRKKCERVTGENDYYISYRGYAKDRGVVRLTDGNLYDAVLYGVEGGTLSNPVSLNISPKDSAGRSDVSDAGSETTGSFGENGYSNPIEVVKDRNPAKQAGVAPAGLIGLALAGLLIFAIAGKGK